MKNRPKRTGKTLSDDHRLGSYTKVSESKILSIFKNPLYSAYFRGRSVLSYSTPELSTMVYERSRGHCCYRYPLPWLRSVFRFFSYFFLLKRKGNSDAPNFRVEQHFLMQVFMIILSDLPRFVLPYAYQRGIATLSIAAPFREWDSL